MKKLRLMTMLLTFLLVSCNGQIKSEKQGQQQDTIKPEIDISVHKEYDEQGNLISIDSIYSYFYSNIKNDSLLEKEIFNNFKLDFNSRFKSIDSLFMKDFFIEAPFKLNDFYTEEYFQNHYKEHQKRIENLYKQMDSLKNRYYLKQQENIEKINNKI